MKNVRAYVGQAFLLAITSFKNTFMIVVGLVFLRMVNFENACFYFVYFWCFTKLLDNENQFTPLQANGA